MNRKDYEIVARVIKGAPAELRLMMFRAFADAFDKGEGCSGFDRTKFHRSCGFKLTDEERDRRDAAHDKLRDKIANSGDC